jgi:hypothetical protein
LGVFLKDGKGIDLEHHVNQRCSKQSEGYEK